MSRFIFCFFLNNNIVCFRCTHFKKLSVICCFNLLYERRSRCTFSIWNKRIIQATQCHPPKACFDEYTKLFLKYGRPKRRWRTSVLVIYWADKKLPKTEARPLLLCLPYFKKVISSTHLKLRGQNIDPFMGSISFNPYRGQINHVLCHFL